MLFIELVRRNSFGKEFRIYNQDDAKAIENREVYGDPAEKSPAGSQAEEGEESDPSEPEPSDAEDVNTQADDQSDDKASSEDNN